LQKNLFADFFAEKILQMPVGFTGLQTTTGIYSRPTCPREAPFANGFSAIGRSIFVFVGIDAPRDRDVLGRLQIILFPFLNGIFVLNVISLAPYIIYYIYNIVSPSLFAKKYTFYSSALAASLHPGRESSKT
jgi:hypothetical protein